MSYYSDKTIYIYVKISNDRTTYCETNDNTTLLEFCEYFTLYHLRGHLNSVGWVGGWDVGGGLLQQDDIKRRLPKE